MEPKKRINFLQRRVWVPVCLSAVIGATVGWGQQKGGPVIPSSVGTSQMQQQQLAAEQQRMLAESQVSAATANPRQVGSNGSPFSANPADETVNSFQQAVRTKRNDERQKRLESDTLRLLNLANQLKNEVSVSGAESMTPEMLRQMDEIEKLAKSVKDRMRN